MKTTGAQASTGGAAARALTTAGRGADQTSPLDGLTDVGEVAVGEYTGAGTTTPVTVTLRFVPSYVELYDQTTAGVYGVAINTANGSGKTHKTKAGTTTIVTNGVIFPAGSKSFTIGSGGSVDGDLGKNGDVYSWAAFGY